MSKTFTLAMLAVSSQAVEFFGGFGGGGYGGGYSSGGGFSSGSRCAVGGGESGFTAGTPLGLSAVVGGIATKPAAVGYKAPTKVPTTKKVVKKVEKKVEKTAEQLKYHEDLKAFQKEKEEWKLEKEAYEKSKLEEKHNDLDPYGPIDYLPYDRYDRYGFSDRYGRSNPYDRYGRSDPYDRYGREDLYALHRVKAPYRDEKTLDLKIKGSSDLFQDKHDDSSDEENHDDDRALYGKDDWLERGDIYEAPKAKPVSRYARDPYESRRSFGYEPSYGKRSSSYDDSRYGVRSYDKPSYSRSRSYGYDEPLYSERSYGLSRPSYNERPTKPSVGLANPSKYGRQSYREPQRQYAGLSNPSNYKQPSYQEPRKSYGSSQRSQFQSYGRGW